MSIKAKLLKPRGSALHVDDWGETVYVRSMTERESKEYIAATREEEADHAAIARATVATCMLDAERGNRIFCDEDVDEITDLSLPGIEQVLRTIIQKTWPRADLDKALDDVEGNSEETSGDGSSIA